MTLRFTKYFKLAFSTALISIISVFNFISAQLSTIKIAATPVPHAEILEFAKPLLKKEGIDLEIIVFNDYVQPNIQLNEKEIDANFIQHKPYLDDFNKNRNMNLQSVANIHIEPMGVYSKKIKSLDDLKEGSQISIPNDVTNGGRALILLAKNNIIKLQDVNNISSTVADIIENPKNLKFIELEAAMLPRTLDEFDLAVINANYALDAGLKPLKDALIIEDLNSPYANIITVRDEDKDKKEIQTLVKVLQSELVKKFLVEQYKGTLVPAF